MPDETINTPIGSVSIDALEPRIGIQRPVITSREPASPPPTSPWILATGFWRNEGIWMIEVDPWIPDGTHNPL